MLQRRRREMTGLHVDMNRSSATSSLFTSTCEERKQMSRGLLWQIHSAVLGQLSTKNARGRQASSDLSNHLGTGIPEFATADREDDGSSCRRLAQVRNKRTIAT